MTNDSAVGGFEEFCGGTFWDYNLTWYTDHPDFTACFQRTAVVWVPCGFLLVLTPFYILYLTTLKSVPPVNKSRLNSAKLVISFFLTLLSLLSLIKGIYDVARHTGDTPAAVVLSSIILMISFIISAILTRVERSKAIVTSALQFMFYVLLVIAGIIPFHSYVYRSIKDINSVDEFGMVVFFVLYGFTLTEFLLFCFAEKLPQPVDTGGKEICPEVTASFLSQITFWWLNGLVMLGYKKNLEENDIWLQNPRYLIRNAAPQLEKAWAQEMNRCKWITKKPVTPVDNTAFVRPHPFSEEHQPLIKPNGNKLRVVPPPKSGLQVQSKKLQKVPSFLRVLAQCYGLTLLKAHLCKLVCDVLIFVGPVLQKYMIAYAENDEEKWKGYFYAALFFLQAIVYSFFFHQLFHIGMTLGMRIKAAVITLVYRKALTISNQARKLVTVGEIVNLMSVDAQRLQDVAGYIWMVWSAPFQCVVALYMLYDLLGASIFAGVGVMLILLPVNGVISRFTKKFQAAQMRLKDQRIKLMNEVLNGIKVLKLYAWEESFQQKVKSLRAQELNTIKKCAYLNAISVLTWTCAPILVTIATFATYTLTGGVLDASKAFTGFSLFNILRFPMGMLPNLISYLTTASVSIGRVRGFLAADDIEEDNISHNPLIADPIVIEQGMFSWGTMEEDPIILKNINFNVESGTLVSVVGQVGAGKSSLLSAILGEMEKLHGQVNVMGTVAYVAQQAWIQNATVRDNILFGKPYDEHRYNLVLDACALRPDLEILPAGDATEIGEKGINLSGGQKQRVSMARAVYQDCDIYLLDDPLSAVDSHVGKHIFHNVIAGKNALLKYKTRVLVTHGIHWLPEVDKITVLVDGAISETGSYDELMSHNREFAQFLRTYLQQDEDSEDEEDEEVRVSKTQILQRLNSQEHQSDKLSETKSPPLQRSGSDHGATAATVPRRRKQSRQQSSSSSNPTGTKRQKSNIEAAEKPKVTQTNRIIEDEVSATGKVKMSVYVSYCKSMGLLMSCVVLSIYIVFQVSSIWASVWLSKWTNDPLLRNASLSNTTEFQHQQNFYLGIYGAFGGVQSILIIFYAILFALTAIHSSSVLHNHMLTNILRSPMIFFETTPIGRILNRFSRDIETIDNTLPSMVRSWLSQFFMAISTIVIISYSTPIFLSVIIPLLVIYYFIQRFYIPTTRQLKRIESTTRSPIYVNFSETITGSSTIRAYQQQERFMHRSECLVDHNLVFYFATIASNRWIGFRLEVLGSFIILAAAVFAVLGRGTISAGIVGLSISYALQVTHALNWLVRMSTDLETNIVSVERINEYSDVPTEADWHNAPITAPLNWPSAGQISFRNYATRYRPGLDLVLSGINVNIQGGEKVGIVGRTGAGKSSMTLALFRMLEGVQGTITIDGFEISELALYPLRSKLVILPQDPVLFSGTLRMNLDPFEKYIDTEIWRALEHAHLKDYVQTLPPGLEYECGEGGQNLSVGQRQLVCLARALLRKTKILVLDEATAAVDLETDELIQKTIRQEFADCTVLTIAHRLNTIMDSNRVMVLDAGKVCEFDSPNNLLANKNSLFYALAKDAGLVS